MQPDTTIFTFPHVPLVPILTVIGFIPGADEVKLLTLISERKLVAFDLRGPSAARNSYPRIFAPSIHAYCQTLKGINGNHRVATVDQVIDWIFPHKRPAFRATELKRQFNISSDLTHKLITAGVLEAIPGTGDKINQTPSVTRPSVVAFLKNRQM